MSSVPHTGCCIFPLCRIFFFTDKIEGDDKIIKLLHFVDGDCSIDARCYQIIRTPCCSGAVNTSFQGSNAHAHGGPDQSPLALVKEDSLTAKSKSRHFKKQCRLK